jgi:hypothetical protein
MDKDDLTRGQLRDLLRHKQRAHNVGRHAAAWPCGAAIGGGGKIQRGTVKLAGKHTGAFPTGWLKWRRGDFDAGVISGR